MADTFADDVARMMEILESKARALDSLSLPGESPSDTARRIRAELSAIRGALAWAAISAPAAAPA